MTIRSWTIVIAIATPLLWLGRGASRTPSTEDLVPPSAPAAAALPEVTEGLWYSPLIARRVISTPTGAEVLRRGAVLGKTPIELELTKSRDAQSFTLRLAGYVAQTIEIVPDEPDTTYVVLTREPPPVVHEPGSDQPSTPMLSKRGEP